MKKKKISNLVGIAILTTLTSVLWIIFSLYQLLTDKPPLVVPESVLAPLVPSLDQSVLTNLQQRYYLEENQIPDVKYEGLEEQEEQEEQDEQTGEASEKELPEGGESEEEANPSPEAEEF